jgi:hypothetical protein
MLAGRILLAVLIRVSVRLTGTPVVMTVVSTVIVGITTTGIQKVTTNGQIKIEV